MKRKILFAFMGIGLVSYLTMAYDFDLVENDIGDSRLVSIAGFMFAKPISIELLPAAEGESVYAISCQIIYKDAHLERPDDASWEQVKYTRNLLNLWLRQYIQEECEGADLDTLCASYSSHNFVLTLQNEFSGFVAARIAEMPPEYRIDVDAVTVQVTANDAFREEIRRRIPLRQ